MLRGRLDEVSRVRIAGWAQDDRQPHQPVALLVIDNGRLLDRVVANRYRPDLAAHGIGTGRHGFELAIEGGLPGLERHVIQVIRERDGTELLASPAIVERADAFDTSARAALRGVLDGIDNASAIDEAIATLQNEIDRLALRRHSDTKADAQVRRALVIDSIMPACGRDAGSNAIISHMRALVRLGYEVSFIAADPTVRPPPITGLDWITSPGIRSVEEVLARKANHFDLVYLHRLDTAVRYMPLVRFHQPRARVIYAVADLHHLRLARRGFIEREPGLVTQARKIRTTELAAARVSDAVITHSTAEAEILRKAKVRHVIVAPWEVTPPDRMTRRTTQAIGFIGHFGHAPNVDAARRLVFDVMPRLRAHRPDISCLIAGSAMPSAMHAWQAPGVKFCGEVDHLGAFFDRLRLTVAPMAYGAGVKGKVLDSLAAGIPCVASPVAVEGLDWPASLAPCVARDDQAFADTVLTLLDNLTLYRRVARAGRTMIARHWSAQAVDKALSTLG